MEYKYVLLKSSWGIFVFLDIEEIRIFDAKVTDVKITDRIYLRMECSSNMASQIAMYWIGRAISDLTYEIHKKVEDVDVCFNVKKLDFNHAHFQEEGLYCATQGWIAKYYNIKIPEIEVSFDKKKNKYFFPTLSKQI